MYIICVLIEKAVPKSEQLPTGYPTTALVKHVATPRGWVPCGLVPFADGWHERPVPADAWQIPDDATARAKAEILDEGGEHHGVWAEEYPAKTTEPKSDPKPVPPPAAARVTKKRKSSGKPTKKSMAAEAQAQLNLGAGI